MCPDPSPEASASCLQVHVIGDMGRYSLGWYLHGDTMARSPRHYSLGLHRWGKLPGSRHLRKPPSSPASMAHKCWPQPGLHLPLGSRRPSLPTQPCWLTWGGCWLASWAAGHLSQHRLLQAAFNQQPWPTPCRLLGNKKA